MEKNLFEHGAEYQQAPIFIKAKPGYWKRCVGFIADPRSVLPVVKAIVMLILCPAFPILRQRQKG